MPLFPISLDVSNRRCVIVGGGAVAGRKARALIEGGGVPVVVAPEVTEELAALAGERAIEWVAAEYAPECLDGAFLAVAATSDSGVNARVVADARARGILVNSADAAVEGDFHTPGVVRRGDLVLSVSTSGGSPTLAAVVREELAGAYGEEWGALTRLCGALRERIQAAGGEKIRREIVRRLAHDSQLRAILKEGRDDDALAHAVQCLSSWSE